MKPILASMVAEEQKYKILTKILPNKDFVYRVSSFEFGIRDMILFRVMGEDSKNEVFSFVTFHSLYYRDPDTGSVHELTNLTNLPIKYPKFGVNLLDSKRAQAKDALEMDLGDLYSDQLRNALDKFLKVWVFKYLVRVGKLEREPVSYLFEYGRYFIKRLQKDFKVGKPPKLFSDSYVLDLSYVGAR